MAGIVLAGGLSRRMGTDKALLELHGERMIARVVRVAAEASSPVIVVADRADRYVLEGVEVIGDERPGSGPLGGIITGLRRAGPGHHVVVACDMPLIELAVLRLLIERARGFQAAVPWIAERPEPLCAVYDGSCFGVLADGMDAGCRAVHRMLDSLRVVRVGEDEIRSVDPTLISFTNINAPEDLRLIQHGPPAAHE